MNKSAATYRENQSAPALAFGAIVADKVKAALSRPQHRPLTLYSVTSGNIQPVMRMCAFILGRAKKPHRIEAIAAELIPAKAKIHKAPDQRLNRSMPWVSRPHPLKGVQAPRDICPYVDNTNSDLGYTEGNPVGTRYSAGQVNTAGSLDGSSARRASKHVNLAGDGLCLIGLFMLAANTETQTGDE